jgi:RNA polymerase sigma-54 factor
MAFQSLCLSQQQRQIMILAPQLRQSLEMLQLPLIELRALIQHEMEQNPTIEDVVAPQEVSFDELAGQTPAGDTVGAAVAAAADSADPDDAAAPGADVSPAEPPEEAPLDFSDASIDTLTALDSEWRDYYFEEQQSNPYTVQDEERRRYMFDSLRQPVSLQNHLLAQLGLTALTPEDKQLGELIIGSLNDQGYLTGDLAALAVQTSAPLARLETVLGVIQEFDPPGIAARDLRECLLIQLAHSDAPQADLAEAIVTRYLPELAAQKVNQLAHALKVPVPAVEEAAALIRALNPQPGRLFESDTATYITPEIFVKRLPSGRWSVVLDDDQLPHIRISNHYCKLLEDPATSAEVKSYIRERIRSGAFLVKSIHQRQKTIHLIASEIVAAQQAFLEHGVSALRPMTMAEVAERVGVHETTVSRTVANKYMQTPVGVFELKYFFTPGLKTAEGPSVSNKTVQDKIDAMIRQESTASPLSDQAIQERLQAEGIEIARRTVAKYRMILKIPPSHLRKRG